MEAKHGSAPKIIVHSLNEAEHQLKTYLERGVPLAPVWYYRIVWGSRSPSSLIGSDVWEVKGYLKKTLDDLLVKEELSPFRQIPPQAKAALDVTFNI